jgi:hypothetical protein
MPGGDVPETADEPRGLSWMRSGLSGTLERVVAEVSGATMSTRPESASAATANPCWDALTRLRLRANEIGAPTAAAAGIPATCRRDEPSGIKPSWGPATCAKLVKASAKVKDIASFIKMTKNAGTA